MNVKKRDYGVRKGKFALYSPLSHMAISKDQFLHLYAVIFLTQSPINYWLPKHTLNAAYRGA